MYNDGYVRTPAVIRSIDSALVVAADDSTKLEAVGLRVEQLLPSGGHFNGSYVARAIYETFGVDSLLPGVANLFAFWRTYGEAEVKRGHQPPFSPKASRRARAVYPQNGDSMRRSRSGTARRSMSSDRLGR